MQCEQLDESHNPFLTKCPNEPSGGHNEMASARVTRNTTKFDFQFARCRRASGKQQQSLHLAAATAHGTRCRHSHSHGQICAHFVNKSINDNNNSSRINDSLGLRRTKSSTGIYGERTMSDEGGATLTTTTTTAMTANRGLCVNNDDPQCKRRNAKLERRQVNVDDDDDDAVMRRVEHGNATIEIDANGGGDGGHVNESRVVSDGGSSAGNESNSSSSCNSNVGSIAARDILTDIKNRKLKLEKAKQKKQITNPFLVQTRSDSSTSSGSKQSQTKRKKGASNTDTVAAARLLTASLFTTDDTHSIDNESIYKSSWLNDGDGDRNELLANHRSCTSLYASTNDLDGMRSANAVIVSGMGTLATSTKQRQQMRRHKESVWAANKERSHIRSNSNLLSSNDEYRRQSDRKALNDKRHNYYYHQCASSKMTGTAAGGLAAAAAAAATVDLPHGNQVDGHPPSGAGNLANDERTLKNTLPDNYLNEVDDDDDDVGVQRQHQSVMVTSAELTKTMPSIRVMSMVYGQMDGSGVIGKNVNPIAAYIPTCPFQRQDYAKPDDEFQMDYNFIDNKANRKSKRDKKDIFGFALPRGILSSSAVANGAAGGNDTGYSSGATITADAVATAMPTSSVVSSGCGGGHQPKAHMMPYLKKLNIHYPNKTQLGDFMVPKEDKKYFDKTKKSLIKIGQKCGLRLSRSPDKHSTTDNDHRVASVVDTKTLRRTDINGCVVQRVQYKSYRSEMDLTRNLHYLDAFLNENFDQLSKSNESQSIGKLSRRKHNVRHYGHTRTKSYTRNVENNDEEEDEVEDGDDDDDTNDSGHGGVAIRGYNTTIKHTADGRYTNRIEPYTESGRKAGAAHKSRAAADPIAPATAQYAISHGISSSDSFSTYNSKLSSRKESIGGRQPQTQSLHSRDVASNGAKSNTTSSSLSSSDYASVYSPSSSGQTGDYNNRFANISSNANALLDASVTHDLGKMPGRDYSTSSRTKRYRMKSHHKYNRYGRNSICNDLYDGDDQSAMLFAGVAIGSGDAPAATNQPPHSAMHETDEQMRLMENTLYQFDDKMPSYQENYLQHYYNNMPERAAGGHVVESNPDLSDIERHMAEREYGKKAMNRSLVGQPYSYRQDKLMARNTNMSQQPQSQRIVITAKGKPFNNDVVLEYEC